MNITDTHRVSIETTYYGPTNHRGSRIKACAGMGRKVWVSYYSDTDDNPHDRAALALMAKMEWTNDLMKGATETGHVYVMESS